jgi:hypothetical protein
MNTQTPTFMPLIAASLIAIMPHFAWGGAKAGPKHYDVAAFVWPSYHPDDRAKLFWPEGIGEWQTVISNKPKFAGHEQPRHPLWGYINEADPYVAEMEIAAAADHGVNVFIFDWYWYDGLPYLEGHLNDGYLKARNNDRVKFYLMWANHDVGLSWDKRNADDAFTGKNKSVIWKGGIGRPEFEKVAHRWIENYFSHPSYYRIDGRPVLMVFDLQTFIDGLGGLDSAKDALSWFRAEVKKAGFPGLDFQLAMRNEDMGSGKPTQHELVDQLGFDSLTHYQFVFFDTKTAQPYSAVLQDVERGWKAISKSYTAKYYPQVSVGWDASPRAERFTGDIITNNPPEEFEKALRRAKTYVDAHPSQAPLITINSWNEWTETSYLQPDDLHGYAYLEAVKRVFVDGK